MGGNSRREYLEAIRQRYVEATRQEKSIILQEFYSVCGYHRKHAIRPAESFQIERLLNSQESVGRKRPGRRAVEQNTLNYEFEILNQEFSAIRPQYW